MKLGRGDCGWVRDFEGRWSAVKIVRPLGEADIMPPGRGCGIGWLVEFPDERRCPYWSVKPTCTIKSAYENPRDMSNDDAWRLFYKAREEHRREAAAV